MGDIAYVVSRGNYSDYRVLCACPTREDAEAVAKKATRGAGYGDDAEVEDLQIITGDVQRVAILTLRAAIYNSGKATVGGFMLGNQPASHEEIAHEWPFDVDGGIPTVAWGWTRNVRLSLIGGLLIVHGSDHERVRKVFSDRRAWLMSDDAARATKQLGIYA